jgi:hypothetical protein
MIQADEQRWRRVALAIYPIAFMLALIPLTDALAQVWPLKPGQVGWRYGAVGIFSSALFTPLLAVFLTLLAASVLRQRWVQILLGIVSVLSALVLVAVLALFALDALQVVHMTVPGDKRSFQVGGAKAAAKLLLAMVVIMSMGIAAFKGARRRRTRRA